MTLQKQLERELSNPIKDYGLIRSLRERISEQSEVIPPSTPKVSWLLKFMKGFMK